MSCYLVFHITNGVVLELKLFVQLDWTRVTCILLVCWDDVWHLQLAGLSHYNMDRTFSHKDKTFFVNF